MIEARVARGAASSLVLNRSADVIAAHLEDAAHFPGGRADAFARPGTEADVAAVLTTATAILPIGAQSSLSGGATPHGGVILSTDRFAAIEPVDAEHVRVGAGVPLLVLQESLTRAHRWYPPVPTFTGACVGGVIATNEPPAFAMALITTTSEAAALALTADLRDASQMTWHTGDAHGIDVSAIEHMDGRCIGIVHEDGADLRNDITLAPDSQVVLFVHIELPRGSSATTLFDEVEHALDPGAADTPMTRLCRLLGRLGVLDRTELAMPGDTPRLSQFLALREAAPTGVNRRVGEAKRDIDPRIEKTAADMIVPFGRLAEMMRIYRDGYQRRGLDFAIWGHISDGNLHPNVLPRSYNDVAAGKEAILEFGREAARMGGCPLAEHGVGRNPVKQQLLLNMYGATGIAEMRAIKRALDPDGRLAPGVLFP